MKGNRAKKAAEAEAAASEPTKVEPTPPPGAPTNGPRPGKVVEEAGGKGNVQLSADEFKQIVQQIRTNELLGAAAADCLEVAAGLRAVASPQSKGAKELRGEVADSREDGKAKKKGMNFDAGPVDEIPDLEEEPEVKKRPSVTDADVNGHDADEAEEHCKKDGAEPPELNLNKQQNNLRTKLEMWVMDEIPIVYGVDDSEELDETLQEDNQADQITFLIAETEPDKQGALAKEWLQGAPDEDKLKEFIDELLKQVLAIQDAGPKKKKKKKKDK